jgi:hypothetical protein
LHEDVRTEIEVVCEHYLARFECGNYWGELDGTDSMWQCPECRAHCFRVSGREGVAGCVSGGCGVPERLTASQVIAVLGDFDPRTERRQINRERRSILDQYELSRRREVEARRTREEALEELRHYETAETEREEAARREEALRAWEAGYTLEEREAVARELERRRRARTPEGLAELREEAETRTRRHLSRLLRGEAEITGKEARACALVWVCVLAAVFYMAPPLQVLGVPLPGWLVTHRFAIGLACGCLVAWAFWWSHGRVRRELAGLGDDEYVGVYRLDDEGRIRWREGTR